MSFFSAPSAAVSYPPDSIPAEVQQVARRGAAHDKPPPSALTPLFSTPPDTSPDVHWHTLPDRALALLETAGTAHRADLDLLMRMVAGPTPEAIAAIRLASLIGEAGLAPLDTVHDLLDEALGSRRPALRRAAGEAFWLLADRTAVPRLAQALSCETDPDVRHTLEHVLRLLG